MKRHIINLFTAAAVVACSLTGQAEAAAIHRPSLSAEPVLFWSTEARRAIVPEGPGGIFGSENYGNKFPGEAAVYMGIVHAAMYDTAVALSGGVRGLAIRVKPARGVSAPAAIAAVTHDVLVGMQPALGLSPAQQAILDGDYANYLASVPDGPAKAAGVTLGARVAAAELTLRATDGRDANPTLSDLDPPAPGPGVWQPDAGPVLGLRLPGMRPLVLPRASMFRPVGPPALSSRAYAQDFAQVKAFGRSDSTVRTPAQTTQALFWTDHDIRQWNDGLIALAREHHLNLLQSAEMLAMAHVAGGDAMIACFDAKYHYWFWRPNHAIPAASDDDNPATQADTTWTPLRATPNFPEYPSAHACHSTAVATALRAFFGTDHVAFSLESRTTGTTMRYQQLSDVITDVQLARILVGFHFWHSDRDGTRLGRAVARYDLEHGFDE